MHPCAEILKTCFLVDLQDYVFAVFITFKFIILRRYITFHTHTVNTKVQQHRFAALSFYVYLVIIFTYKYFAVFKYGNPIGFPAFNGGQFTFDITIPIYGFYIAYKFISFH